MALRTSELTNKIEAAFADEWVRAKAVPLPGAGAEERRLLFTAVARGVLEYLQEKDDEIFRSIVLGKSGGDTTTWDIVRTDVNLAG